MSALRISVALLTILVTSAGAAAAGAVSPIATSKAMIVVTDGNPSHLYALDFTTPDAPPLLLNPNDQRTGLHDLVVRDLDLADRADRIDLLVFDRDTSEILRYARDAGTGEWLPSQVIAGSFLLPDGLSLNGRGALYFVDNPSPPRVWVLPPDRNDLPPLGDGFAGAPVLIDEKPPCNLLVDTEVVKFQASGFSFGDLLVLCQEPPLVLRYRRGLPCQDPAACSPSERQPLFPLPAGETPTSLVFTPGGNLLISTDGGVIVRLFLDDGSVDGEPFVTGLPPGDARMVGGIQERGDGTVGPFLFYGHRDDMSVRRYAPGPGGGVLDPVQAVSGVLNPVVFDGEGPVGVGIGTSRAVPTRAGDGTRLRPRESLLATFDRVRSEGLTESRILRFQDPRTALDDEPVYLCEFGSFVECPAPENARFVVDLGLPNVIPAAVRPLVVKPTSSLTPITAKGAILPQYHPFVLFDLTSTAGFEDTVKLQALEELVLNEESYRCDEATGTMIGQMPLFFHGADLDDPAVVEGDQFFPVGTGCGSNFGRTFAFSSFLVGRLAVPGPLAAALPAVQGLRTALDPQTPSGDLDQPGLAAFILPPLGDELFELADGALQVLPEEAEAIKLLETLLQKVRDNPGEIDDSERNVSGEVRVRATAAIFLLCGGTNCSDAVDTHAEDVGEIFTDGFESGDTAAWSLSAP